MAELNADGLLVGSPRIVDSADKIKPGSGVKVFNLLESEDRQKLVIFSVNTTNANSIKVRAITLNKNIENSNETEISINSTDKKSSLSDFALDNNGNLFCLRNVTQNNMAPAVSLLYLSASGAEVVESAILNYSLLLDDIRVKIDNKAGRVILNSYYATTQKEILKVCILMFGILMQKEILTNSNKFTDAVRGLVTNKRNLKGAFDMFYLDKVSTQADGSFVVISEAAESYSNRTMFSRWDYFYGGAFYNPFMFNYWNRPFGFYPWARFGWGPSLFMWNRWMNPYASFGYPSVTYNANNIALLSFDIKGNLQWVKTIDKKQTDQNVDQFIGYGSIQNESGMSFVYHQKQKGVHQLIVNTLSKEGQLVKGNSIILNEKITSGCQKA